MPLSEGLTFCKEREQWMRSNTYVMTFMFLFLLEFTGLQGLIKVYGEWQTGAYMGFEDLCST